MRIEIDKNYFIAAPANTVWDCLKDMEDIEDCMPGVCITEKTDNHHYTGLVKVKLGPRNIVFDGVLEVLSENANRKEVIVVGTGKDANGDRAEMELTASVEPKGDDGCELNGNAIVTFDGRLTNMGAKFINKILIRTLEQFVKNLSCHAKQRQVMGQSGDVGLTAAMSAYEDTYVESSTINGDSLSAVSDQNSHRIEHSRKTNQEEYIDVLDILWHDLSQSARHTLDKVTRPRGER